MTEDTALFFEGENVEFHNICHVKLPIHPVSSTGQDKSKLQKQTSINYKNIFICDLLNETDLHKKMYLNFFCVDIVHRFHNYLNGLKIQESWSPFKEHMRN